MKVNVDQKLRIFAIYLWQVYRFGRSVSDNTQVIFTLPAAVQWFKGMEENLFQDSYDKLDDFDTYWFLFLLLDIEENHDEDIDDVVYKVSNDGKITIISNEELDAASQAMFGEGEIYGFQEDPQINALLAEKSWERFNFCHHIKELISGAKN